MKVLGNVKVNGKKSMWRFCPPHI